MKKIVGLSLFVAMMATACYHQGQLAVNPSWMMQYQFKPTEATLLAVAKDYAEAINSNLKEKTMHPGLYADYGVALALLGCDEQANTMFNNEKVLFPNSSMYVDSLKHRLVPFYANEMRFDTAKIDLKSLDTIKVTLTAEEAAQLRELESDPEYQRQQKQLQKEEKERMAKARKKAKAQAAAKKEAERKAQAKERARLQKEKEKAKKEQEKARKEAAKKK